MTAFAFQCLDCRHLEEGPQAGDMPYPRNCRHCDVGSHLATTERPQRDPITQQVVTDDAGRIVMEPWTEQVIDRDNVFLVLADAPEDVRRSVMADHADPADTIVRWDHINQVEVPA